MNTSELLISGEHAILLLFKVGIVIFLLVYIVFAGVIMKQVRMMTDTLEVGFEIPIKVMALFHFLFSLAVLILAIIIL